jgi:Flp pilus assembly protein TadG
MILATRVNPRFALPRSAGLSRWFSRNRRRFGSDTRGVAGIEFAVIALMLVFLLLNVVDVSIYIYKRMQVEKAAQMGAQAAFNTCDETMVPATTKCPDLNSAINAAISSTSLGADVTLKSGSPAEAYYCINDSGELQYVSSVSRKPDDCSGAGMASLQPADYLTIDVEYDYEPLFADFTVARLFSPTIVRNALIRLS